MGNNKELTPKEAKDERRKANLAIAQGRVNGQYREKGKPRGGEWKWRRKLKYGSLAVVGALGTIFAVDQAIENYKSVFKDPNPLASIEQKSPKIGAFK